MDHAGLRNGFAQVIKSADPADDPLDPHAESPMRHRAETAQVEVPLERFGRQLVVMDALEQQVVVRDTLTAANNLAIAFRREHIHAQRDVGPLRTVRKWILPLERRLGSQPRMTTCCPSHRATFSMYATVPSCFMTRSQGVNLLL